MTIQAFPDCSRGQQGQLEVEEDVCNTMDEASNGYDHDPSSRETTGRWTRDEHLTFIKGLELYGKGWKKIASLIKTRTVVQIRTHAQKYFLKLTKARQCSSSSCDSSNGFDNKSCQNGIRKRRHRRKKFCRLMSVTPVLHPFIKVSNNSSSIALSGDVDPLNPTIDADRTLYDFLTPKMGEKTMISMPADGCAGSSSAAAGEDVGREEEDGDRWAAAADRDIGGKGLQECSSDGGSVVRLVTVEKLTLTADDRQLPDWYSRCEHVSSLLKRADTLNWLEDSFTAIPIPEPPIKISAACNTSTSATLKSSSLVATEVGNHPLTMSQSTGDSSCRPPHSQLLLPSYSSKSSSSRDSRMSDRTDDDDAAEYSNGSDSHEDDELSSSSSGRGSECTDGEPQPQKKRRSGPAGSKQDSCSSDESESVGASSWIDPSSRR